MALDYLAAEPRHSPAFDMQRTNDHRGGGEHILWDVVREHLEEAGFALIRWQKALCSPLYTLAEVAATREQQLIAHIDALVLGGPTAATKMLVPELLAPEDPVHERSVAAALALVSMGQLEVVWKTLSSDEDGPRAASRDAFALGAPAQFEAWLSNEFGRERAVDPRQRAALLEIAARRALPLPGLSEYRKGDDPQELISALVAARVDGSARHSSWVERLIDHEDADVRDAALFTALCFGSGYAWERCVKLAAHAASPQPFAMLALALLGDPSHHAILVEQLLGTTHRTLALKALAFCGQAAVVPTLLPHLASDDATTAAMASLAIFMITGLETSLEPYVASERPADEEDPLPPLDEDDLDADLIPPDEVDLPPPDGDAIVDFWKTNGQAFDTRRRLLLGKPWTLATFADAMERVSAYSRRSLLPWLTIRSGGMATVSLAMWTATQRAQLERARTLGDRALVRRFGGW